MLQCDAIIQDYFPVLWHEVLFQLNNPKDLCVNIGMCRSARPRLMPRKFMMYFQAKKGIMCEVRRVPFSKALHSSGVHRCGGVRRESATRPWPTEEGYD